VSTTEPPDLPAGPADRGRADGGAADDHGGDNAAPGGATAGVDPRSGGGTSPGGEDTEPEDAEPARRHHPWRIAGLIFVLIGVLVIVGGYLWVSREADPPGPLGAQVIVTVRPGTGINQLASSLQAKGVIGSPLAYRIWSQVHSIPAVQSGSYAFNRNDSFADANRVIAAGPNVFPLDIPPGFTVSEVAARVGQLPGHQQAAFAALAAGGTVHSQWQPVGVTSLEGLLGTGRYVVVPGETDLDLLTDMVNRFDNEADALNVTSGSAALGLTPYQLITVASIVQKEGVIQKNLGPVARVILNRLHNDMPLQMDSTVLFALGRDGGLVTSKDLQTQTPYNTYLNQGLTPTPICFPSLASLKAALDPPAGSWLYFVLVKSDGTEAFADTLAEQQANEALAKQRGLP
jgi:UPF0755 protein